MLDISIHHLHYRYPTQLQDLLSDISFTINSQSRIGLVGHNGCGKTTLFKLLCREIEPTAGSITGAVINIAYLRQEILPNAQQNIADYLWEIKPELLLLQQRLQQLAINPTAADTTVYDDFFTAGGYDFTAKINKILPKFNFTIEDLPRNINELSGGEQTKLALLRLLLTDPALLLLDEPTNHLDAPTLIWLEDYLLNLTIPYIIISHDRAILNRCMQQIVEVEDGRSTIYQGSYDFYQQQKTLCYQQDLVSHQQQKRKIRHLQQAAVQREQWSKIKQKQTRSVTKTGGICKRDDGSLRISRGRMTNVAKAIKKRQQHVLEKEQANKPYLEKKRDLLLQSAAIVNKTILLNIENLGKTIGNKQLFSELNLQLPTGTRLAITGANGCGKSTLLRLLTKNLPLDTGKITWAAKAKLAYYNQMASHLNLQATVLENCSQLSQDQTLIRTTLGQLLFNNDLVGQLVGTLSLGERSKVALAMILLQQANVLLLDEPTNHLEIAVRLALEDALINYSGTVIFVSHDRDFRDKLMTMELAL